MRDWMDDGTCTQVDPELFFDDTTRDYALSLCAMCPVLKKCREWAVVTRLPAGVAGGMTATARLREARRRGVPVVRDEWAVELLTVLRARVARDHANARRAHAEGVGA